LGRLARRPTLLATLAVLVGAALWGWAAYALWSSTPYAPTDLPDVDPHRVFTDAFLDRSATYQRFLDLNALAASVVVLVVLGLYARRGHRLMRESAAGRVGTGMLLGMLGFAIVWLTQAPFGLAAVWWQRRYEVSHQGYLEWGVESFLSLGGKFLFVSLALAVAMGLAGALKRWWWAAAVPVFAGLGLLFAFVSPYLIPYTEPARDREVLADVRALERAQGISGARVVVQDVDRFTTAPNAVAAGFGPTRTIVLWGTLLDDRFSREEVRAVIGHEIAHLAHNDALRGVAWLVLFLIPATALIAWLTRGRGGLSRPEAVPVALFALVALTLATTPLFNLASRQVEAAADWAAVSATGEPAAERSLLRRLATTSLGDPDPPGWAQALFAAHPSIVQRIAAVGVWEERTPNARPGG
jgi:STE24 endopeptidase